VIVLLFDSCCCNGGSNLAKKKVALKLYEQVPIEVCSHCGGSGTNSKEIYEGGQDTDTSVYPSNTLSRLEGGNEIVIHDIG